MKFILRSAAVGALLLLSQISLAAPVPEGDDIGTDLASIGNEGFTPAATAVSNFSLECATPYLTSMCKNVCACVNGVEPYRCSNNAQCTGEAKCTCRPK